jgi:hypothetical protein
MLTLVSESLDPYWNLRCSTLGCQECSIQLSSQGVHVRGVDLAGTMIALYRRWYAVLAQLEWVYPKVVNIYCFHVLSSCSSSILNS